MKLSLSDPYHHNRSRFRFVIPHRYRKSIGVAGVQLEKTLKPHVGAERSSVLSATVAVIFRFLSHNKIPLRLLRSPLKSVDQTLRSGITLMLRLRKKWKLTAFCTKRLFALPAYFAYVILIRIFNTEKIKEAQNKRFLIF